MVTNSITECSPKQLANLDTAIQGLDSGKFRNQLEQTFYSHLSRSGIIPNRKRNFKKRADSLLGEIAELNLLISSCARHKEYQFLCQNLKTMRRDKLSNLAYLLTVFNSSINYSKLFEHITANHADLKSQSLEVLKGAIGPKRMDAVTRALLGKLDDFLHDPKDIGERLANHSNPEISALLTETKSSQPAATL